MTLASAVNQISLYYLKMHDIYIIDDTVERSEEVNIDYMSELAC